LRYFIRYFRYLRLLYSVVTRQPAPGRTELPYYHSERKRRQPTSTRQTTNSITSSFGFARPQDRPTRCQLRPEMMVQRVGGGGTWPGSGFCSILFYFLAYPVRFNNKLLVVVSFSGCVGWARWGWGLGLVRLVFNWCCPSFWVRDRNQGFDLGQVENARLVS
jgi:hypothetical protein